MKRVMACLLALMLLFAMAVPTMAEDVAFDVVKDFGGITLKVWKPLWWTSIVTSDDVNTVWKVLEQKFNVHFEFIQPSVGSEQEQFNLLMAGGELPDIIMTDWSGTNLYTGGLDKYVEEGVIIDLLPYAEKWAPNYLHCIETEVNEDERAEFYTDAGYMTQFYAISPYEEYATAGLIFRADWMTDLGLELPETLDDVETILTRFKDEKGATAPLFFASNGIPAGGNLLSAYGIGPDFYNDNGTVKYGPAEAAFKDYLLKMNDWYTKGLIDVDFVSRDFESKMRMLTTGESGAIVDTPDNVITYMMNISPMVGGTYPTLNPGERVHYREKMFQCRPPYCAAITTECKNIEAAMTILDYGYTYDGWMLCNYGIEGFTYNMEGDTAVYTDVILNNPEYPSLLDSIARYKWHIGPYLRFEHEADPAITQENMEIRRMLTENADSDLVMPMITMTADENGEYASIMAQITTYQDAAVVNFICGKEDIETGFDGYIETLKKLNIDRAIALKQAALDRYLAR